MFALMDGSNSKNETQRAKDARRRARAQLGAIPRLGLAALFIMAAGCNRAPELLYLPDMPQPAPVTDLPREMRIENWIGRGVDGDRGGSCVHASTINCFRTVGRPDLEQAWVDNRGRGYEGPETGYGIMRKFREQNIPFATTDDADASLFEEATESHRPGIIFYYPSHCINFVEFAEVDGKECAILLDNNFTDKYIVVDRDVFERSWKYYGGFGLVPWVDPVTPRTFPRAIPKG